MARGANTERIRQFGHDQLKSYGGGKAFSAPYLQALIRQALASAHLDMDIERFGALKPTSKGHAVLADRETFECKSIVVSNTAKRKSRQRKAALQESALSDTDNSLLAALKSKRMEIAREIEKPAFMVFSDATLIDMTQKRPANKDEMLDVSGVGEVKFERFGRQFLEVFAAAV